MPPREVNLCFGKSALTKEQQKAEYRRKYRESKSGFIDCECGTRVRELCVYSHRFSRRHTEFMKSGIVEPEPEPNTTPVNVDAAIKHYQALQRAQKTYYERTKHEKVPKDSNT